MRNRRIKSRRSASRLACVVVGLLCAIFVIMAAGCGQNSVAGGEGPDVAAEEPGPAGSEVRAAPEPVQEQVVTVPPAPKPTGPLPADAGCVTAECHATFASARYIHGAVSAGDCMVCHEPDQGDHHYPLTRSGQEQCTFCHAVSGNRAYQHEAIEVDGCIVCHDPHVSETKFLLTGESVEAVCEECHYTEKLGYDHAPFAAGECVACHQAHE